MSVWAFGKMIRSVYFEPMNFDHVWITVWYQPLQTETLHAIRAGRNHRRLEESLNRQPFVSFATFCSNSPLS